MSKLLKKLTLLAVFCTLLCNCTDETNGQSEKKYIFYCNFSINDGMKEYSVLQGDTLKIPVSFFSSSVHSLSPEVLYYIYSADEENQLIASEDYQILDSTGEIMTPNTDGTYSILWDKVTEGTKYICINSLTDKSGGLCVSVVDPNKLSEDDGRGFLTLEKNNSFELRTLSNNSSVTVKFNEGEDIEEPENPEDNENILASWDFEGDNALHDLHFEKIEDINSLIVDDPLNENNKVMYFELPAGSDRREVMWADGNNNYYLYPNNNDSEHGDEFWIGFKVYVPKLNGAQQNNSPSIFQVGPISNRVQFDGSYGFYQLMAPSHYAYWRWRKFISKYSPVGNITETKLSSLRYNQWEKFVIHCKLKNNDNEGLIEIWKNGERIYTLQQKNAELDTRVVIKWGVYIGTGNSSKDVLSCYYDDIKIGNALSGYDAVVSK